MRPVSRSFLRTLGVLAAFAGLSAAGAAASCSLIVESRSTQCQSDADCKGFPGAACDSKQHICVDKECAKGDCVCNPETSVDILNGCPKGECLPFDNGRTHLPADGGLPPQDLADAAPDPVYTCPSDAGDTDGSVLMPGPCENMDVNPLYITGPDSIKPLLAWVAKRFAGDGTRVIFQANSSCTVVKTIYKVNEYMLSGPEVPNVTTYFDEKGGEHRCYVENTTARPHIALSDVFPQTCGDYNTMGTGGSVKDTAGPVQAMGFVVPDAPESKETSISREAAYLIYGLGADVANIEPWTDPTHVYQRTPSSGTQQMIAKAVGLDAVSWFKATTNNGSFVEAQLIGCSDDKKRTLGILAVDVVQSKKNPIRLLAYRSSLQDCAYFPDSTETANDKANVRNGHYFIWGPIHMLSTVPSTNDDAQTLIDLVSGNIPADDADIFQIWADAHLVPQCAMEVRRNDDGGPLSVHHPSHPCGCRYDEVTGAKNPACKKCSQTTDCPEGRPVCNLGYCELAGDP